MTFKSSIPALALALALALSSSYAQAQNGPALSKAWDTHSQKVQSLEEQLWSRNMEYEALANNPNAKLAEIKAIVDQMSKLNTQLRREHDNYYKNMEAKGYGGGNNYGNGYAPRSYQGGYDQQYHQGGGYGNCWGGGGGWHNKGRRGHHGY